MTKWSGRLILGNKLFSREIITGTQAEHEATMELKQIFSGKKADNVYLEHVDVMRWSEEECFIEAGGYRIKCYSLPYTLSADIESQLVFADYHGESIALPSDPYGKIVVIPYPPDPDDAKFVLLKLYSAGASAVIFYDTLPGRYRRIVVTGVEGYPYNYGAPPPIPAICITKEDYLKLYMRRIREARVYVETSIEHGAHGYNVVAVYNGSSEHEIVVSAHHDHWFTGFSDDLLGLEVLVRLADKLEGMGRRYTVVLVSFTAEESGAPGYSGWYWIWGSRRYLENRLVKGDIDYILLDINVDALFTRNVRVAYNPFLHSLVKRLVDRGFVASDSLEIENPYFDSFSFTLYGIPSLTLHTFNELRVNYHTNLDDGRENDPDLDIYTTELVYELIRELSNRSLEEVYSLQWFRDTYSSHYTDELPLETRVLFKKLSELYLISNNLDLYGFSRMFTRSFLKPVATYRMNGLFETMFMPELMVGLRVLRGMGRCLRVDESYYVPGVEERILEVRGGVSGEFVKALYEFVRRSSARYMDLLNDLVGRFLRK